MMAIQVCWLQRCLTVLRSPQCADGQCHMIAMIAAKLLCGKFPQRVAVYLAEQQSGIGQGTALRHTGSPKWP